MKLRIGGHMIDLDVEEKWSSTLGEIKKDMDDAMKKRAGKAMEKEIRRHVSEKYPGSEHWNPQKINEDPDDSASVNVDVAGAVRNYWDVDIYPVEAPSLVYPTETGKDSYGLKEWKDIYALLPDHNWFEIRKNSDRGVIAAVMGGSVVALFNLRQHVFQGQDPTLLPTDDTLCGVICAEFEK